jgi:DUF1365 family protein
MTAAGSAIYAGNVVHKRLAPKRHGFKYRVFALALDVDEIDALSGRLRLFSRNRRNAVSFHDCDHGRGDGTPVGEHARRTLASAGLAGAGERIVLLAYPRIFGFVFNPLSVYFCHGGDGGLRAVIYEVSNTFGERTSYVIPAGEMQAGIVSQACAKTMYVSPFTAAKGHYGFHVRPPAADVVVGVDLRSGAVPVLKTHFRGTRHPLTDGSLTAMLARHPMMTVKVLGAIHLEALRLWLKGIPLVRRHTSARYAEIPVPTQHRTRTLHDE